MSLSPVMGWSFSNFLRPDRPRQLIRSLVVEPFDAFPRQTSSQRLIWLPSTQYELGLPVDGSFPTRFPRRTAGQVVLQSSHLRSCGLLKTEKFPTSPNFLNVASNNRSPAEDASCASPGLPP